MRKMQKKGMKEGGRGKEGGGGGAGGERGGAREKRSEGRASRGRGKSRKETHLRWKINNNNSMLQPMLARASLTARRSILN